MYSFTLISCCTHCKCSVSQKERYAIFQFTSWKYVPRNSWLAFVTATTHVQYQFGEKRFHPWIMIARNSFSYHMCPEGVLNWKKHPSHQGRSKYGIFGSFQWEMCTNALFWPSLTHPANLVKFFWSKMACTGVPHIVLRVSCGTRTSGGYFWPSEVRFRGILALSRDWFYNGKKQKCKFLKKP